MVLATFRAPEYAHLARSYLAASGIDSFISDEHVCQWNWHLTFAFGGIKLHVDPDDFQTARETLRETAYVETEGDYELISVPRFRGWLLLTYLLTGGCVMPLFFGRETIRMKRGDSKVSRRSEPSIR